MSSARPVGITSGDRVASPEPGTSAAGLPRRRRRVLRAALRVL